HTHIAFVVDATNEHTLEGQARKQAFELAMSNRKLTPITLIHDSPHQILLDNKASLVPCTAFIAYSDHFAGKVLRAALELGIVVPTELSVIGFDSSTYCDTLKPKLTSLRQPVQDMAFEATKHLLSIVRDGQPPAGSGAPTSFIHECRLDIRESTAPPLQRSSK
ncbi:MAG TPA: substrate-binding domain-containing protein, partial [Fimbriimonas sp.]|nr:substrate-binding domain-containing protein [Fimbriimonas sp.]